jgi:peptidoglycan/LPS O-acetylase OafA/YrhL
MSANSVTWRNPRLCGRIVDLDGIRGLAILSVLVWHYVCGSKSHYGIQGRLADVLVPFNLSWSGVDLFFVLSGFLIGGILYDAKYACNYYRTFYFRRCYRILPLYLIWLVLFLIGLYAVDVKWYGNVALFNYDLPVWSYCLFLQNVFVAFSYKFGAGWMLVTWSLAVEEQFYILLPFMIRNLSLKAIVRLTVGVIVFAPALRFALVLRHNYYGPYTLLPCRADALGFGVLLALACRNQRIWTWLTSHRRDIYLTFLVLGVGLSVFILRPRIRLLNTVGYSWLAAFYASLLLLVLVNPGKMERLVFRNPVLVRLGTIAYAVYLLHQGINGLYHYTLRSRMPSSWTWCITVLSLVTVLVLAETLWRVLERPLIRRAHAKYNYVEESCKPVPVGVSI